MRDVHAWRPSKFEYTPKGIRASRDPRHVSVRSRLIVDAVGRVYERAIRAHARGTLADLGCGRIPLYQCYVNLVDDVICVDWENTAHPNPHVDYVADLNESIPLPDLCVDTILATDVLEHLSRPERFWTEATRILRPTGKLIVGVPFLYRLHEDPHDHFRYTSHRLRRYCEESRLEVLELTTYGGPFAVLVDLVGKNAPAALSSMWQRFGGMLLRVPPIRRADERRSATFPLGYCLVAQKRTPDSKN